MQFAVILHECFKCHGCYSASIKVNCKANALLRGNVFLWFTWSYFSSLMRAQTVITAHELHWIHTISWSHMCTWTRKFFLFDLVTTGNLKSSFVMPVHVITATIRGRWAVQTVTRSPLPRDTMCRDWQIDWPTDWGSTWQVEIGKWEAHFSLPSAEQKIKAFFLRRSNRKRWSTKCPSAWIATI